MSSSPFPLPVLFTAWVWHDGAGIAGEVIRRANLGGFKTVAVQLREATPADSTDDGRTLDPADVKAMQDAGLFVVGWDSVGTAATTNELLAYLGVDGWLPQVVGPGQREDLFTALRAGVGIGIPRALVTTYGGLDTLADVVKLRSLWGADPFTFVECYKADGPPHEDIDKMLWQGQQYGFDPMKLCALVGTYRGETAADYPGLSRWNYGGAYLVENMTDDQLRSFAPFAAPAPTPEPPVVTIPDPRDLNKQISELAASYLDANSGDEPLARLRSIYRIANTSDAEWYAARDAIVAALNGETPDITALKAQLATAQGRALTAERERDAALAKIAAAKAALT